MGNILANKAFMLQLVGSESCSLALTNRTDGVSASTNETKQRGDSSLK